ncbi:MAG: ATP-binding protein [Alphaproteobacteria bacterium]|nr:ATP-binding protein [Alphaproteobacteria bacterium]
MFVNGPRQAGKSTLVRHIARHDFKADYVTLDDITTLAATDDPESFLRGFPGPVIIDEVQLAPGLFRALKKVVDERRLEGNASGIFLLTGSANVMALPELSDALVGRMAVLTLYPMAACEMMGKGQPVIHSWFDQDIKFHAGGRGKKISLDKTSLQAAADRATFPEIALAEHANRRLWYDGYLTTLLQRDVRQLADIEKVTALPNMLSILAARAGSLLNDADAARDAKLNAMTYRRYRTLLQQLFLITLIPPWHRNVSKRLVKAPKLYVTDTGLLCHLLGVDADAMRRQDPGLYGHILENFVASELIKQVAMTGGMALHHFRTHDGKEVDFVIERRGGKLIGIEVKAAMSVEARDFAGLKVLKEAAGKDFVKGVVLYLGKDTVVFGEGMAAMPLERLWG